MDQAPLLPWTVRSEAALIERRIDRWKATAHERLIGDAAAFYLPYAEAAIAHEPEIRIVCLRRSRDEVVAAFAQFLNDNSPLPINHWARAPAPDWNHDPLWTPTFPQYETRDRAAGIGRYWEEYYQHAEALARRYPDNIIVVDAQSLTVPDGVRGILDFIGVAPEQQVVVSGQPPPPVPPTGEQGDIPLPRYADPLDPRRCIVLVPFVGGIHEECEAALKELERRGYTVSRVSGYAAIDQARNQLATDALMHGFEETLWIDSDIGFHPDDVDKLRRHRLPIVGGIYAQKGKRIFACEFMPGMQSVTFGKDGGLLEIRYAGTGFLLIRREVYTTIQNRLALPVCNERFSRPMIPFFQPIVRPIDDGHWYLAEDYSFCERARQCGFAIHADTSIRLGHIGNYRYGWEDVGAERALIDSYTLRADKG